MKKKHTHQMEERARNNGEEEDFYSTLNLSKDASPRDIRNAYRSLVKRWHPDKNPPSLREEAEAKFKAISQAYEALNDKENRNMFGVRQSPKREDPSTSSSASYKHRTADFSSRNASRRPAANTTSSFSYTTAGATTGVGGGRRKPPAVEKKLECSLEDLCFGCVKKMMITRDVISPDGKITKEQEFLKIKVKPGWKKGTKITFEGMGDERPGALPADIIFSISEKHHPLFKREGNDLVLAVEIPLIKALTGCTLSIPLLGGEKTSCSFDEVIYPGFEKVIRGQGMPDAQEKGGRGDLRIKFRISFPTKLSEEQRSGIVKLLQNCSS
ncbi:hypothetical protein QJS04_geneDACA009131 [Acorus gramineus]|uniref:J domain-containing protein n=1 Tax=Acorus gramineus TaxID=55184 RepID=A0AAV9AQP1_ACOGR|nr:hypothetical protein QJS04_geneDACA009131 [Acorus gramineus]